MKMKIDLIIIILTFLFILWTVYFIYQLNKPIIYDISSPPQKEIKELFLDETKMLKDAKM